MINRIDEGHTLAITSINRLDDLLNRRPDGVKTSHMLNNFTEFMSTIYNLPGGDVPFKRVTSLEDNMITQRCDELDLS